MIDHQLPYERALPAGRPCFVGAKLGRIYWKTMPLTKCKRQPHHYSLLRNAEQFHPRGDSRESLAKSLGDGITISHYRESRRLPSSIDINSP